MGLLICVSVVIIDQLWHFLVMSLIRRQLSWIYLGVTACYHSLVLGVSPNSLVAECSSSGTKKGLRRHFRYKTCWPRGIPSANRALAVGELLISCNQTRI